VKRRSIVAAAAVLVLSTAGACSHPSAGPQVAPERLGPPYVYVAVGASETAGIGTSDPAREAWPQVFAATASASSSRRACATVAPGIPRPTVTVERGRAVAAKPQLVTVWLNVNDLLTLVKPADYEAQLGELVHGLRRDGATRVLLANTPDLDRLPAYVDCYEGRRRGGLCDLAQPLPTPDEVRAAVTVYNTAIARVAEREGATLVDLHSQGEVADVHPDYISRDGFHPSAAGHRAVAALFATALGPLPDTG
jgi:lysophospholipase L1-like esterase